MPKNPADPKKEHEETRITAKTQFFCYFRIRDSNNFLPNMMADLKTWDECMRELRVKADDQIVVYDNSGMFSAPRAFLMLRYFGAKNVKVLNGGMKKWKIEERPTVGGPQEMYHEVLGDLGYSETD